MNVKKNVIISVFSILIMLVQFQGKSQIIVDKLDSLYFQEKYDEIVSSFKNNIDSKFDNPIYKGYLIESMIKLKKYKSAKLVLENDTILDDLEKLDIIVNNECISDKAVNKYLIEKYVDQYISRNGFNKEIVVEVSKMIYKDQYYRSKNYVMDIDSLIPDENQNTIYLNNLFHDNEFPTPISVGETTIGRIMLLIAHSYDLTLQKKFLKYIYFNKEYPDSVYGQKKAILTDKILLEELGFQIFGTQIEKTDSIPVPSKLLAPKLVNDLRKRMGLVFSMEAYLDFFK